jgi:hypothetical protein
LSWSLFVLVIGFACRIILRQSFQTFFLKRRREKRGTVDLFLPVVEVKASIRRQYHVNSCSSKQKVEAVAFGE